VSIPDDWHGRGLCSCLSCRRAVIAGPDGVPLYDPTFRERQALWALNPALTFSRRHSEHAWGGFHLCCWK
jgi:hypothetical protein